MKKKQKKVFAGILAAILCTGSLLPAHAEGNFVPYETHWPFWNTSYYFGTNNFLDEDTFQKMKNQYRHTEKWCSDAFTLRPWGGSCYGMCATSLLSAYGEVDYTKFKNCDANASSLYHATFNQTDDILGDDVMSYINYYASTQFFQEHQQEAIRTMYRTDSKQRLQKLVGLLEEGKPVLITIGGILNNLPDFRVVGSDEGDYLGHAVIAYQTGFVDSDMRDAIIDSLGSAYADSFDRYVDIYDLNYFAFKDITDDNIYGEESYGAYFPERIYYNSQTWDWIYPIFNFGTIQEICGENNDGLNEIHADPALINTRGLSGNTGYVMPEDYIDIFVSKGEQGTYSLNPITLTDNGWQLSGADMSEAYLTKDFLSSGMDSNSNYILPGEERGYVFEGETQELENAIFYQNSLQYAYASNASQTVVDPSGYISVSGSDADYTLELVFNENYSGGFFDVKVSGHADDARLQMTSDGYLLHASNLNDVFINAEDGGNSQVLQLNAEQSDVLLKKNDSGFLTAYVDEDNDGIYETPLEENGTGFGDIDQSGTCDAEDASLVLIAAAQIGSSGVPDINQTFQSAADVNKDGNIDASDAALLLEYSLKLGSGDTLKTLFEYVTYPNAPQRYVFDEEEEEG